MSKEPLVSVIIPTYNGEKFIKNAIDSVLQQDYNNIEIIVINDCSKDKSLDIIFDLQKKDKRIKVFENDINFGFVKSLNIGTEKATGKYIARLDDDDLWIDKDKLKKQVAFLEKNSDYVLVGSGVIAKTPNKEEIIRYLSPETDKEIKKSLLSDNVFAHSSVVFLKNIFEEVGKYSEKFGFFSDWDLWLKMGILGKLYNFQEYFIVYTDKEMGYQKYFSRDKEIRRKLLLKISMLWKYKNEYKGFLRAFLLCIGSFFYSFLPFRNKLRVFLFMARTKLLGTPYKYK